MLIQCWLNLSKPTT